MYQTVVWSCKSESDLESITRPGYTGHVRGGKYSLSKQTPASGPESFSPTGRERLSLPLGEKDAGGVPFVTTYGNSYGARES